MHFIAEILKGDGVSDYVHQRFTRYGRGSFDGPVIVLKKAKNAIKVNSTEDYVNVLGETITRNIEADSIGVKGKIICKRDIKSILDESNIGVSKISHKKAGLYTYEVDCETSRDKLAIIYSKIPDAHVLIDLTLEKPWKLKCKKAPPKPGSGADENFCSAALGISALEDVMKEILFDLDSGKDFDEVRVEHTYNIEKLMIPEECRKDPAKARIQAKRRGVIKRIVVVDGVTKETEHKLLV